MVGLVVGGWLDLERHSERGRQGAGREELREGQRKGVIEEGKDERNEGVCYLYGKIINKEIKNICSLV